MKSIHAISLAIVPLLCSGCAHVLTTAAGAGAGGLLGHTLGGGSALAAAGGAAGGALLAEGAWALNDRSQKRAFEDGYTRGRADNVKSTYFSLQGTASEPDPKYRRLTITLPARREGGVLYEPQTTSILIAE